MGKKTGINLTDAVALKLIHELQAYQKELEQKNEKLITANEELYSQNDENKKRIETLTIENNTITLQRDRLQEFTGFVSDISEQNKENDAKLLQSFLINSLLDAIPDVIFLKDSKGIYQECNNE
jgi:predicted nuclease with TOPRIM domain